MTYIKYSLLMLPALTFGILPNISTMPWTLLLIPLLFRNINRELIYLSVFFGIYLILSFFLFQNGMSTISKSSIALLNATIIIPYIYKASNKEFELLTKVLYSFCIISIVVGILQTFIPATNIVTQFLFGRASGFTGGKGVPGLSTEPARSALDLMYVTVTIIFLNRKGYSDRSSKYHKLIVISVLIYLIFFNRSNTSYIFILVYFGLYIIKNIRLGKLIKFSIIAIFIGYISFKLSYLLVDIYAIKSAQRLIESEDKFTFLMQLGGHRIVGLLAVWKNLSFFGNGIGGWLEIMSSFLNENYNTVSQIGFYRTNGLIPTPPMTFFGRFILEIGVIGLIIYFRLLTVKIKNKHLLEILKAPEPLFILSSLLFLSYGGSPIPFLCLACIAHAGKIKNPKYILAYVEKER